MSIPSFHKTMNPILDILKNGEMMHISELAPKLLEGKYFELTDEEKMEETSSGANKFADRVSWGKVYLKQGKFIIQPQRGYVQITEKGENILKNSVSINLAYLNSDKDFIEHKKKVEIKKEKDDIIKPNDVTPQDMIDFGFKDLTQSLKADLLERLQESNPYYFEKIILELFQKMGYGDITVTKKSGDGGIDGIINQDALGLEKIYTQAKRYTKNKVGERDIRNFKGAMDGSVAKGIFVTTSDFDLNAIDSAKNSGNKIVLINGEKLVELMIKYNLGVQTKTTYNIKEIDEDFFVEN